MKTITKDELKAVLDSHELWLHYGKGERAALDNTDLSCIGDMLENAKLCRASLKGIKADGQSMRGIDLTGADLTDASLINAQMEEACLAGAVLDGINAAGVDLTAADLVCTSMKRANLAGAGLNPANLCRADLRSADLSYANLAGACLACAGLDGANLTDADLTGADLGFADMDGTDMSGAKLDGVQLYGIHLYDSKKMKGAPIYTCGAPDSSAYVWIIAVLAAGPVDKWRWFMCGLDDSGVLRKDLETALGDSFDDDEIKHIGEAAANLENKILNEMEN